MPRKRIIDPEFWSDEEIGQWSHEARLFYIGLWNFADDVGRFKAHPQLLKSQIFPYDQKFNIETLKKELNDKVQWYEVSGLQYGYLRNFNKHQRIDKPSDSKLPAPPPFVDSSTNVPRTLPPKLSKDKLSKEKRSAAAPPHSEDFLTTLKTNPVYKGIDIDRELGKMDAWLSVHPGRQKTQRFIINWLNKIDKPMAAQLKPEVKIDRPVPINPEEHKKVAALIHATAQKMKRKL